jgi:hypothetical protein
VSFNNASQLNNKEKEKGFELYKTDSLFFLPGKKAMPHNTLLAL